MKDLLLPIILLMITLQSSAQSWLDQELYPFESKYLQLEEGKMHYVDQGKGPTLLFVHGTPTWSFVYREMISALSKNYRCIAIDHLGFGLSDKPLDFAGTPEAHAANLSAFIDKLGLDKFSLVVHDFGGPIGLGAALTQAHKVESVVLLNSWLWETKSDPAVQKVNRMLHSRIGRFLYLKLNFSPRILLKQGFTNSKNLSKNEHQQYLKPFPDSASRETLLKLGQSLYGSSDWYAEQFSQLHLLEAVPWMIAWGTKDEFIHLEHLEKWKQRLPTAELRTYECGHFVQEEAPASLNEDLERFFAEHLQLKTLD